MKSYPTASSAALSYVIFGQEPNPESQFLHL